MKLAALLAVVALMSLGQILFKLAAARIETVAFTWATAEKLILNPYLVLGVIVYGLTTVLWVLVLVDGSLSRAYPFVALTMVAVPLAGIVMFGEPFTTNLALGGMLILLGLAVISYG